MPGTSNLAKAELVELDANFRDPIAGGRSCKVQFNPESLKVSFANQLQDPPGASDQRGTPARQFVGSSTTKLALTLWFDVGSPQAKSPPVDDVRKLTQEVADFMEAPGVAGKKDNVPPAVRFQWGSFVFDGVMDSLEETLEYFSSAGKPLRASLALALSQKKFQFKFKDAKPTLLAGRTTTPGTKPLTRARPRGSVQGLADAAGKGDDWQSIAAANGIENPRALGAGAMLDLDLEAPTIGAEFGIGGGVGVGIGGGLEVGFVVASPSLSIGAGAEVDGGFSASAAIGIGG